MRQPDRSQVLGGGVRRARHRLNGEVQRRQRPAVGESECLLQRSELRAVCATRRPHGSGARDHGQRQIRAVRADFQARQLRFRAVRGRK